MKMPKIFRKLTIAELESDLAAARTVAADAERTLALAALAAEEDDGAGAAYAKAETAHTVALRRCRQLELAIAEAQARADREADQQKQEAAKAAEAAKAHVMAQLRAATLAMDELLPDIASAAQQLADAIRAATAALGEKEARGLALNKLSIMIPYVVAAALQAVPSAKRAPLTDEALASLSQYLPAKID